MITIVIDQDIEVANFRISDPELDDVIVVSELDNDGAYDEIRKGLLTMLDALHNAGYGVHPPIN